MIIALLLLATLLIVGWRRGVAPLVAIANLSERAMHGDFALELKPRGFALVRHLGNLLNYLLKELDRYRVPHGAPRRRATDTR
jgi:signal transduction histidine kinase